MNNFILKRKTSNKLKFDEALINVVANRSELVVRLIERITADTVIKPTISADNLLLLNLNHTSEYGHIYSEVLSELYAIDNTYPEYDRVVTIGSPLITEIIEFFGLTLSKKIHPITDTSQTYRLNFNQLELVNHVPRSYNNQLKNVLALKAEFHRLKPIINTPKQYLIFCSRSSKKAKHGRNITKENEEEIVACLKEYAEKQNLEFYFLTGEEPDGSKVCIAKQYELFTNAKLVVGPHGGAFSNLIFLDPEKKPKVIEFCTGRAKSFSRLFGEAIDTFAEYNQLSYILPPNLLKDIESHEPGKKRNRYISGQLRHGECTIALAELKNSLQGVYSRLAR
jgi:uncharacterized Fe-S cluster-containing radical SAM superfamily protein